MTQVNHTCRKRQVSHPLSLGGKYSSGFYRNTIAQAHFQLFQYLRFFIFIFFISNPYLMKILHFGLILHFLCISLSKPFWTVKSLTMVISLNQLVFTYIRGACICLEKARDMPKGFRQSDTNQIRYEFDLKIFADQFGEIRHIS